MRSLWDNRRDVEGCRIWIVRIGAREVFLQVTKAVAVIIEVGIGGVERVETMA